MIVQLKVRFFESKNFKLTAKIKIGPQSEHGGSASSSYLHLKTEPALLLVHRLLVMRTYMRTRVHTHYTFIFIPTRCCLPFLPNCCKCDIITVGDRLLRKRSKEKNNLANKPQKPYQKIRFFEIF